MTTTVTVKVPEDANYKAIVVALDAQPDGPSRSFRIEIQPGGEQTFYAHATRVIEVSEESLETASAGSVVRSSEEDAATAGARHPVRFEGANAVEIIPPADRPAGLPAGAA